jgi:hypothetical protein
MMAMHLIADMIVFSSEGPAKRTWKVIALSIGGLLLLWAEDELSWVWAGRVALGAALLWLILFAFDKAINRFAKMRGEH